MNNLTRAAAAILIFLPALGAAAGPAAAPGKAAFAAARASRRAGAPATLQNAYINVALDPNGEFTIGTVEGDPSRTSDNNKDLLYGHPNPSTSDTMIKVDGVESSIHTGASSGVSLTSAAASVTLNLGQIEVLQRLTIVKSPGTRYKDTIQVYFKVTNVGGVPHAVSLRTQLDTLLGSNDGAPFRVPGVGEVVKDKEFDNDPGTLAVGDIPSVAVVFDQLKDPSVIALFSLRDVGYQTPDRVVFGYWPVSVDSWDYVVDPARSFTSDSSVIIWWGYPDANAFTLAPGESKELAFLYGLGDYTFKAGSPFDVGLFSPAELEGAVVGPTYRYYPEPFTVSAFLSNVTGQAVRGAKATLNLRPEFTLAPGETATKNIEGTPGSKVAAAGTSPQVDWKVLTNARYIGERKLSVSIDAGGAPYTVTRDVRVLNIPGAIYGLALEENGAPIAGAAVTVLRNGAAAGAAVTQADGTYVVPGLPDGEYGVKLSRAGRPDVYSRGWVSSSPNSGRATTSVGFQAASDLQSFSYPNPVREGNARITFYSATAGSAEVEIFDSTGRKIKTIADPAGGAGWREVLWAIDDVANGVYFFKVTKGGSSSDGKIAVLKWRGR